MSGVITPEAVRLEFEAAGVGSRAIALLIDLVVVVPAVVAVALAAVGVYDLLGLAMSEWTAGVLLTSLVFALVLGYPAASETLWRGRTLGKAAMGLRVVTSEGAPVGFRHASIRAALGMVDFWITSGLAGLLTALLTRDHQRLGDLVAGTIVLRERSSGRAVDAFQFAVPLSARAWAATLDVAALNVDDYGMIRRLLLRAPSLRPEARSSLARQVAESVGPRLHPPPPVDLDAQVVLTAVAARYQQQGGGGHLVPPSGAASGDLPAPPSADQAFVPPR